MVCNCTWMSPIYWMRKKVWISFPDKKMSPSSNNKSRLSHRQCWVAKRFHQGFQDSTQIKGNPKLGSTSWKFPEFTFFFPQEKKVFSFINDSNNSNNKYSGLHKGLIVINKICQISRKKLDFAKFCKLQEAIWLTVINEIFKFPPHFDPFVYVNYLYELSLGYPNYPTQKWNIWASSQSSWKRFRKLQESIWLTVVDEIFKFSPHLYPFGYLNCLYEIALDYANYPTQKWYIRASFHTSRKRFCKLQEAIWLPVIYEIPF